MAYTYRIYDQKGVYFITCTVNQWVDVFTRKEYVKILLDSLRFCQKNKGLEIFSWVVMTNHIHLIIGTKQENLSDIIRDFKKYTSTKIVAAIRESKVESRKKWMLWLLKKEDGILFWQEGYHGEEITTPNFYKVKQDYIHNNPVTAGMVEKEGEYLYRSCGSIYGIRKGLLTLSVYV
jgi:putative transposase